MEHPLKFLSRKAANALGARLYTFGRPFLLFCPHRLERVLEQNDFVVLEKEFQEYLFSFLYLMALVPEPMFRALMRLWSARVLRALSTIEKRLGKIPFINALGAHIFLLCYKKN